MEINAWYQTFYEARLKGRYITLDDLSPLLGSYANAFQLEEIGRSVNDQKIFSIQLGHGPKKVLAWSQMHGNESTTTKALFDLFAFLHQKEHFQESIQRFFASHTLCVVPMLNPDGALAYTRENTNGVDLNRDAQLRSQPESRALRALFDRFSPDLCLNLHDQRTIYGLSTGKSATISFLSPAANESRSLTKSRKVAMKLISKMATVLSEYLPGQVGRYDDSFNANCVGDTFQSLKVPTILFEAGHYPGDYGRETTREYIFYAYLTLFGLYPEESGSGGQKKVSYRSIPENKKNYRDLILRNARFGESEMPRDIAIQYEEKLQGDGILLVPLVDSFGDLSNYLGHKEMDLEGSEILLNYHENVFDDEKVSTIVNKNAINQVFFKDSFDIF